MGKYGKKVVISTNPLDYSILLAGEGGIGKTGLSVEMCDKLVGNEGYLHLNIGKESGVNARNGAMSEPIEDWEKLVDVTDDIIENKETDYPNLKILIWDSLDELILLGEKEQIRQYNKTVDDSKKAKTILQCWGGFGKGQDRNINTILDIMWALKGVGVQSFIIAHTKRSDIIDPVSQETFSQLTADIQQRYFNAVKNKMDIVAMGYIDREIVTKNLGRKNIVTKKEITTNKIQNEVRVICFRDDENYAVDSKCRFANIAPKIPFDTDEFITAIQDAINAEMKRGGISDAQAKKEQKKKDEEKAKATAENSKNAKENKIDEDRNEELREEIKEIASNDADKKEIFKGLLKENNMKKLSDEVPTRVLESILEALK